MTCGINYFGNRGWVPHVQDQVEVTVFCRTVLLWHVSSVYQSFRAIRIAVITVTAKNYSYLCFSDEETQAGGYMTWVRSVKKSAGWKHQISWGQTLCSKNTCYQIMQKYNNWKEISLNLFFQILITWSQVKWRADSVETYITWKVFTL